MAKAVEPNEEDMNEYTSRFGNYSKKGRVTVSIDARTPDTNGRITM